MSYPAPGNPNKMPRNPYDDPDQCYFCPEKGQGYWNFHGKPMCPKCNDKFVERIKLILSFQ